VAATTPGRRNTPPFFSLLQCKDTHASSYFFSLATLNFTLPLFIRDHIKS